MIYVRTAEHRRLRAQLIHRWRPWERSTGPTSAAGKARVARNAFKGGLRQKLRSLSRILRDQAGRLEDIESNHVRGNHEIQRPDSR